MVSIANKTEIVALDEGVIHIGVVQSLQAYYGILVCSVAKWYLLARDGGAMRVPKGACLPRTPRYAIFVACPTC